MGFLLSNLFSIIESKFYVRRDDLLTVVDKSNYLRGLLILAKKDNRLIENEKKIIRDAAKRMGFSKDFYEETLRNLMNNNYILEKPIIFSNPEIAKLFISEGLELAFSDNELCVPELNWLKEIANANAIPDEWFSEVTKSLDNVKVH